MKNTTLKFFAITLVIAISTTFFTALATAAETRKMPLNHTHLAIGSLEVDGRRIIVGDIPDLERYNFIWLQLRCPNSGERVFEHIAERSPDGNVVFEISAPPGLYYLYIFRAAQRNVTFTAAFWPKIKVNLSEHTGAFLVSEAYFSNAEILAGRRKDMAALQFYLQPSRNIQSDHPEILSLAAEITTGLSGSFEITLAIHDWVASNIYYNRDDLHNIRAGRQAGDQSALGALRSRAVVCYGFTNLTAALLRAAGVPARVIYGYAGSFSLECRRFHAWNEAYVNGRWVIIDTTWNSANVFEHGNFLYSNGLRRHQYFDISPIFFAATHSISTFGDLDAAVDDFVRENARTAVPFCGSVRVNGIMDLPAGLFNIGGFNYIKLRDAAAMLSFSGLGAGVDWDNENRKILIDTGVMYTPIGGELSGNSAAVPVRAELAAVRLSFNGETVLLSAYSINGFTYFRLRDVAALFGFGVDFDVATQTIHIAI